MKLPRLIPTLTLVGLAFLLSAGSASASQYTITCQSGQWDMLSVMFMQQSFLSQNYYVYGGHYDKNGNYTGAVFHSDVVQITSQTGNTWNTGKINSIKDYQGQPDGKDSNGNPKYYVVPPYWAYPWDINLFDNSYVYLWITEGDWGNAYSYKKFNNSSSDYSMLFTRRCVVPSDNGTTSALVNNPTGQGSHTTEFQIHPQNLYVNGQIDRANETFTSADCSPYKNSDLGYALMNVLATKPNGFSLQDTLHGGNISLTTVPVTYRYNGCDVNGNNCQDEEEFDFGVDPVHNDNYGLVQWIHYKPAGGPVYEKSVFNQLKQWTTTQVSEGYGGTNVSFPCP